jgi:hypothetical protein
MKRKKAEGRNSKRLQTHFDQGEKSISMFSFGCVPLLNVSCIKIDYTLPANQFSDEKSRVELPFR